MIYVADLLCLPNCLGYTSPQLFTDAFADVGSMNCVTADSCTPSTSITIFGSLYGEHVGECIDQAQCTADGGYSISEIGGTTYNVCVESCKDYLGLGLLQTEA